MMTAELEPPRFPCNLANFLIFSGTWQDYEYLQLYASMYGRHEALALLEKSGAYTGPERYALEHGPIESLRGEVYRAYRPPT